MKSKTAGKVWAPGDIFKFTPLRLAVVKLASRGSAKTRHAAPFVESPDSST
jgi:hypothetical protein